MENKMMESSETINEVKPAVSGMPCLTLEQIREYRAKRNESQRRFWSRFGVTQSRGSRFELGNAIPQPVMILLTLYFSNTISDTHLLPVTTSRIQLMQ